MPINFNIFKFEGISMISKKLLGLEIDSLLKMGLMILFIVIENYEKALNLVS